MKQKIIILFLVTGIIIYTLTLGTNSYSNIFLILIYVYMLALVKNTYKKESSPQKNKEELLAIINNIPIAAFLKDFDNNIITANKEFFRLFNIKEDNDYSKISKNLYSRFDIKQIEKEDKKLFKTGDNFICEKDVYTDNSLNKCTIYKTPIYDSNKKVREIAVFVKNINVQDCNSENNQNIIATLTHDLKTPAVAQIRALELLLKGNLGEINDSQRSFLTDILNSCNNMLDMVIIMLWLYKFDNKKVAVNVSSFNVNDLIKDILNENKLTLNSHNHKFEQNNKTAQIHIVADKMHIKRIMCNLIMNAVSHSKENSKIFIETSVENNSFVFKVKNQGEFLSDDKLECIFDKNKVFCQKSDGLSTGLGLYLSNSLLELNGGKFLYNSSPEGFNTFGFTINLCPEKCISVSKDTSGNYEKQTL